MTSEDWASKPEVDDLPGLNLESLRKYLENIDPVLVEGQLQGEIIAGGRSNLTYKITDGLHQWVVRRPPLGHVLATAHDMGREYRVMTALTSSTVPVPRTLSLCEADDVLGAPFYVMSWSEGATYRWQTELEPLGSDRVHRISTNLVATLVDLHAVEPSSVGLSDFGRPNGYLERQVRTWGRQLDSSRSRDLAGVDELRRRLGDADVPSSDSGIVHGDFRLDNVLVGDHDEITTVLDWEMATLGDPLIDVALMVAYDQLARTPEGDGIANASLATGFLSAGEVLSLYSDKSGRDLSNIGFHLGLSFFKLAVILEGIHFRYANGQTVGDGFDRAGDLVIPAVAAGLKSIKEQ